MKYGRKYKGEAEACPIKNNKLLKKKFELTKKTVIPDEYGNT